MRNSIPGGSGPYTYARISFFRLKSRGKPLGKCCTLVHTVPEIVQKPRGKPLVNYGIQFWV